MYCMNNIVLIDHHGLFIFVDVGYSGSFHDVTILKNSWVENNWRQLFTNRDEYCEFVQGDQGYIGVKKYIMCGFSKVLWSLVVLMEMAASIRYDLLSCLRAELG